MENNKASTDQTKAQTKRTLQDFEVVTHPQKSTSDLGKGSYGSVKLVKEKGKGDKLYAMKIVCTFSEFQLVNCYRLTKKY